jgi:hypothetical protein
VIHSTALGKPVAWLPAVLNRVVADPAGRTWAGVYRSHLYLFTLEGEGRRS